MKILYLLHNDPRAPGGTEKHAFQLAASAMAAGHDAVFFYPRVSRKDTEPAIQETRANGIGFIELSRQVHNNFLPPGPREKQLNQIFESVLKKQSPDVIHIHHLKNLPSGCLPSSLISGARVVFSLQDYEYFCLKTHLVRTNGAFCERSDGGANCVIHCLPRALRARAALWRPLSAFTGELYFSKYLRAVILERQILFKKINCVLAASRYVIDRFEKEGFKSPDTRLLELGINHFDAPEHAPAQRPVRFLFLGNINHEKGIDLLLDSFKQISPEQACLTIHGGSVSKQARPLLETAQKNQPNIKYAGPYQDSELQKIFSGADCVLIPSRRHETFSLVLSEAWMAKKPVIAAAAGALSTRIKHGKNGLLFKPGNLEEMSRHIKSVIDKPETLYALRRGIPDVMSIEKYYARMEQIYKPIQGRNRGPS